MWNHNLQTLLVGTIMAVSVTLGGCDSTKEDAQNYIARLSAFAKRAEHRKESR